MSEQQQPFRGPGAGGEPGPDISDEDELRAARAANRFDIRRIIGGVLTIYGVALVVAGVVGTSAVKNKADGININLWAGLGMLVVGVFMISWALLRPVVPEPPERRGRGSGRIRRAPAT